MSLKTVAVFMACCLTMSGASFADGLEGARWRMTSKVPVSSTGIRVLDGGDGSIAFSTRRGSHCVGAEQGAMPPASYLYFDVDDTRAEGASGPIYLVVEYYDAAPGGVMQVNYDSATGDSPGANYLANEDQWGGWLTGKKTWETAVFLLAKPLFRNRENLGADFRLGGATLWIRSMALTHTRPALCDKLETVVQADLRTRVKIGAGGQLIIGGFDPARREDVRPMTRALRAGIPMMKSFGVTSHEGYVRWNLCEPEQGRYDWSVYDAYVDLYKQSGLKWVPFLIVGSAYSLPDW